MKEGHKREGILPSLLVVIGNPQKAKDPKGRLGRSRPMECG